MPSRSRGRRAAGTALRLVAAAAAMVGFFTLVGLLITHVLVHSRLERADGQADVILARDRTPTWNTVTHYATLLAETRTVVAVGLVIVLLLGLILRRWREAVFLAVALVGEVTIFVTITLLVHRHRPPVPHLDAAPPTSSFPSGHTAAAVALYGGLAVLGWRSARRAAVRGLALLAGVAAPVAVAMSRVYRGMHFPSDVIAGALLAAGWLAVLVAVLLSRSPPDPRRLVTR